MIYSLIWILGMGGARNAEYVSSYIYIYIYSRKSSLWASSLRCEPIIKSGSRLVFAFTWSFQVSFLKSLGPFIWLNKYNTTWLSKRFVCLQKWIRVKTLVKGTSLAFDWNVFQTARIIYVCISCLSEIVLPIIPEVVASDELAPRGMIRFVTWIKWGAALFIFKLILFHTRSFNQECYIFFIMPLFSFEEAVPCYARCSWLLTHINGCIPTADWWSFIWRRRGSRKLIMKCTTSVISACQEISTNLL